MLCPFCRKQDTSVVDSRPTEDGTAIRRRRVCSCERKERFTTFERVQFRELTVVKNSGRRAPFDRDKIMKSITIALRKRPIDSETIDKFISELTSIDVLSNKFIESVVKSHTKRKVVELFTFNTNIEYGELYNKELPSATIEEKIYPIRYILSEAYQNLIKRYFPDKIKSLKDMIYEKINVPEFNDGVDLETGEKLIVCIFLYKKPNSKFKNGIYISRDGIDYNSSYTPKLQPNKNN